MGRAWICLAAVWCAVVDRALSQGAAVSLWTPLSALDNLCNWDCDDSGTLTVDQNFGACMNYHAKYALCETGPGRPGCYYSRYTETPPTQDACGFETVLDSMTEFWKGRFLYLVRTSCVSNGYFTDAITNLQSFKSTLDAAVASPTVPASIAYLGCLTEPVADAAARLDNKYAVLVAHLENLEQEKSDVDTEFTPASSSDRNAIQDDNWECADDFFVWRPAMPDRRALVGLDDSLYDSVSFMFELEMCTHYIKAMVKAHSQLSSFTIIGCVLEKTTNRVLPFVATAGDATETCTALLEAQPDAATAGFGYGLGCRTINNSDVESEHLYSTAYDYSRYSPFYSGLTHRIGFRCMLPWFPRGTVALSAPAGYVASRLATGGDRTVTAVLTTAARQSCADACSAVSQCTGFLWETGLLCRLVVGAATPADEFPGMSYRVRLAVDGLVPKTARTAATETVYRQTRTEPAVDTGAGPWTVFGAARLSGVVAASRDTTSAAARSTGGGADGFFTDGSISVTPAGCGDICGGRPNCVFSMWLSSHSPCYFMYGRNPAAVRAADVAGAGPRCARRVAGFDPAAAETAAICELTPGCAFVNDICTDLSPPTNPRSGVTSNPPAGGLPAVFLVPQFRKSGTLRVPFGVSCEACSGPTATAECTEAADIVVPATVTTLTAASFSGCTNLRRLTVMAPAPHFESGALAGAPGLEKISFGTADCGPDAHHHCSGTADAGAAAAFPSCVGPDPAIFGFATTVDVDDDSCTSSSCADCEGDRPFTWIPLSALTSIEVSAFANCARLISVDLRDATGLTVLPADAFAGATQLATLHLGTTLTEIGAGAFFEVSALTEITGGDLIETIGTRAFTSSGAVRAMPAWPALATLGGAAFRLAGAAAISTGPQLSVVPPSAFESSEVVHLEIGANVHTIGVNACANCAQLRTVEISGNVLTSIGQTAFQGCVALETLVIPDPSNNQPFALGPGALFSTTALSTFRLPASATPRDFIVGAGDTLCFSEPWFQYSGGEIFYHCAELETVNCAAKIDCPDALGVRLNANPAAMAFAYDAALLELTVPAAITAIGPSAFQSSALHTVTFVQGDTDSGTLEIGELAFYRFQAATLDLSDRSATILRAAFTGSLLEMASLESVTAIGEKAFSDSRRLHTATFGNSLTLIGPSAFADCPALLRVNIPGDVAINAGAFSGATGLRAVSLGGVTVTIDPTVFDGATSLDSFQITHPGTFSGEIPLPGCPDGPDFTGTKIGFCTEDGQFPSMPTVATPVLFPYPPAPVVDPAPPATRPVSLRAPIHCIPCDPVPGTVYDAGRSFIPNEILTVGPSMLADCSRVTSVSVAETTRFETDPVTNSWRSPVLTSFTVRAAPSTTHYDFDGTVPRCIMNLAHTIYGPADSVPEDTGTFTCVPCSTDPVTHDLTVPSNVRKIPEHAFSDCDISGTLQFATPDSESLVIVPHAFDMDEELGGKLGTVIVPVAAIPRVDDQVDDPDYGIGEDAFKSATLQSFLVAVPATLNNVKLEDFTEGNWKNRISLAENCAFPAANDIDKPPRLLNDSVTLADCGDAEAGIRESIPGSAQKWSRLFGTCRCEAMEPGCFGALLDETTVVLPNATAAVCGGDPSRIGPVYLDVDTVLLPGGLSAPFDVSQPGTLFYPDAPEDCVVSGPVRYPATAADGGACTICGHSETCSSPNEHFPGAAAALGAAAPAPGPTPPPRPPVGPPVDPLPSAGPELGIWLTVGGGSAIMLIFIGRAVWRRWGALRRSGVRYSPVPGAPAPVPL